MLSPLVMCGPQGLLFACFAANAQKTKVNKCAIVLFCRYSVPEAGRLEHTTLC